MTNKEKFIKAAKITAKEYYNNTHASSIVSCAYCKVILKDNPQRNKILYYKNCKGCPMSTALKEMECTRMRTFDTGNFNNKNERNKIRAKFHENIIPIMKKIDSAFFTRKEWRYKAFEEIREMDKKLYLEYKNKTKS